MMKVQNQEVPMLVQIRAEGRGYEYGDEPFRPVTSTGKAPSARSVQHARNKQARDMSSDFPVGPSGILHFVM
ncbi:MAG: hypothetical protein P4M15_06955 [Alphaproteobacteria bacterium]|nr:hypothetical protein [Alphaproteobacteria bacterium]